MSLKSQDACDFVIGRLSDTLGRPTIAGSDCVSGWLAFGLAAAIAVVGGRQSIELAQQLVPRPSFEDFARDFAARHSVTLPTTGFAAPLPETAINTDTAAQMR